MISVTLWRKTIVRLGACPNGLALFDAIASGQSETDTLRRDRIKVANWTVLHSLWLAHAQPGFCGWLRDQGLIPIVNYRGADLGGADLGGARNWPSSRPIPDGWALVDGVIARRST